MKHTWYLLKNRRYEGPFRIEDLSVRAQQGALSPDDYLIDGLNFDKGHIVYRKASEVLPRNAFSTILSAPEKQLLRTGTENTVETRVTDASGAPQESYKSQSTSTARYQQENVSALSEWFGRLNFTKAVGFCGVVLAGLWFFGSNETGAPARQPADIASAPIKKQVEVVRQAPSRNLQRDNAPKARVQRLMPTERPTIRDDVTPSSVVASEPVIEEIKALDKEISPMDQGDIERNLASEENTIPPSENNPEDGQNANDVNVDNALPESDPGEMPLLDPPVDQDNNDY